MKIETDTLKYATLLMRKGLTEKAANAFVSATSAIDIANIYSKYEVDSMLNESTKEIHAEFKAEMKDILSKFDILTHRTEDKITAQTRWIVGTIIASATVLASLHWFLH